MEEDAPPPVAPLPDPERPILYECLHNHQVYLNSRGGTIFDASTAQVDMVRKENAKQAYIFDTEGGEISLEDSHGPGWGRIFFAFRLPRVANNMFRKPLDGELPERVAIKCLNINVVETALRTGSFEDPYREIYRMEAIGDNLHVLKCIEALKDEENMYIVMPYCEKSLADLDVTQEPEAHQRFLQSLHSLKYLKERQICHRNLSPTKFWIHKDRVVLSGLGQSFQLPPGQSIVTPDTEPHGAFPFQPPEVYCSSFGDGWRYNIYQCDLWASALTVICLLTGGNFHFPCHQDLMCKCFIWERGITGIRNDGVDECLKDADLLGNRGAYEGEDNEERNRHTARIRQARLLRMAFKIVTELNPSLREILDNVLKLNPGERWNLDVTIDATSNLNYDP